MDNITVIVVTSPIPSHPDTRVIDETVSTIRTHLPDSEIIFCIDGVREEQEDRRKNYVEYTRRLLWKINNEWGNAVPLLFEEHQHQAKMTRKALELVKTPLILFVEHDTPITPDREIPFQELGEVILSGKANLIRFHYEALVLDVHKHLMIGEPEGNLWATAQFSQRPHLASVNYYRHILDTYFTPGATTFIEDRMYGVIETSFFERGKPAWDEHRLWIYHPEGDIKRSYTTDGREDDPKFGMTF